jgi:hypothetical protein
MTPWWKDNPWAHALGVELATGPVCPHCQCDVTLDAMIADGSEHPELPRYHAWRERKHGPAYRCTHVVSWNPGTAFPHQLRDGPLGDARGRGWVWRDVPAFESLRVAIDRLQRLGEAAGFAWDEVLLSVLGERPAWWADGPPAGVDRSPCWLMKVPGVAMAQRTATRPELTPGVSIPATAFFLDEPEASYRVITKVVARHVLRLERYLHIAGKLEGVELEPAAERRADDPHDGQAEPPGADADADAVEEVSDDALVASPAFGAVIPGDTILAATGDRWAQERVTTGKTMLKLLRALQQLGGIARTQKQWMDSVPRPKSSYTSMGRSIGRLIHRGLVRQTWVQNRWESRLTRKGWAVVMGEVPVEVPRR